MVGRISIVPLAAESLGVRSMCTFVETPDLRILLDAGVSLCPRRFGLPPHPIEFRAINESRDRIAEAAEKADVVTISHYHFDHHTPSFEDWLVNWTEADETARRIYEGKTVLIKNPREKINSSQRQRAWMFQQSSGRYAEKLEIADGRTLNFGSTKVKFSEPVPHGPDNSELGWVLMITVEFHEEKIVFAPDVQGPMSRQTLEKIIEEKPQIAIVGGPPLYLVGLKTSEDQIRSALDNLTRIVEAVPIVILEHHVLRDENWREKLTNVLYRAYRSESSVLTAAEFLRKENMFLEAQRKTLFVEKPPSRDFEKWMNSSEEKRKRTKPPI